MENMVLFGKALIKKWWPLMSCAVFTFLGLYALMFNKSNRWLIGASFVAAACLFVVAAFSAWDEEYKGRLAAEGQLKDEEPKIIFGLLAGDIDWSNLDSFGELVFTLTNVGKRVATYVHIAPVKSVGGTYAIYFQDTDVLRSNAAYHPVAHEIEDGSSRETPKKRAVLGKRMLWNFLHNCPAEQHAEAFEVVITFKDMGEQRRKTAIMRWDLNTKKLTIDPN